MAFAGPGRLRCTGLGVHQDSSHLTTKMPSRFPSEIPVAEGLVMGLREQDL